MAGTWLSCFGIKDRKDDLGTTADQLAARQFGTGTPLPSLELAGEGGAATCSQSGGGCGYGSTTAFRTPFQPLPMEDNPRKVFFQLFGQGDNTKERKEILSETGSLLDYVMDESKALNARVGPADRARLSDYLDSIREVESAYRSSPSARARRWIFPMRRRASPTSSPMKWARCSISSRWPGRPTRRAWPRLMIAKEISMRTYPNLQITEAFHPLSHHGNDPDKMSRLVQIQNYHTQLFAKFIDKLSKTEDGNGSLLDHSIILYGSNMSNSDLHNNDPLPNAILGRGYGRIKGGQHLHFPQDTPHANLLLTLLNRAGVETPTLGQQHRPVRGDLKRCRLVAASWKPLPLPVRASRSPACPSRSQKRRNRNSRRRIWAADSHSSPAPAPTCWRSHLPMARCCSMAARAGNQRHC